MNLKRGILGYKIPEHLKNDRDELVEHILNVAQEQLICNLPTCKVIIFLASGEEDERKEIVTFKVVGGKNPDDEDDEQEDEEVMLDDDH
jgi:hypothetical protein